MSIAVHPKTIRHYRQLHNLNQTEFAEKVGVNKDQVSRWETGKVKSVRGHTLKGLVGFLGVSPEQLSKAPPASSDRPATVGPKDQLNVRVSGAVRNALRLVCHRYNITQDVVVSLAPLLLLVTAEASLRKRSTGLAEVEKQMYETDKQFERALPHLIGHTDNSFGQGNEDLHYEEMSIEARDIFNSEGGNKGQGCPFTDFLVSLTNGADDPAIGEIISGSGLPPFYTIAPDTLEQLTGLSNKDKEKKEICAAILDGQIDLKEVISARERLSVEEYLEWLRVEVKAAEERQRAALEELSNNLFVFSEQPGEEQ